MRSWGSWVSEIRIPQSREKIWLGSYATAQQAARAHDAATLLLHGPSSGAFLNFSDSAELLREQLVAHVNDLASPRTIQSIAAAFASAAAGDGVRPIQLQQCNSDVVAHHIDDEAALRVSGEINRQEYIQLCLERAADYEQHCCIQDMISNVPTEDQLRNSSASFPSYNNDSINASQSSMAANLQQFSTILDDFHPFEGLAREGFTSTSAVVMVLHRFDTDSEPCEFVNSSLWSYFD